MVERRTRPHAQVPSRMYAEYDGDDFLKVLTRCETEDWVDLNIELAERNEKYAKEELEKGHVATARYFYGAAAGCWLCSQYGMTEITEEKMALYHRLDDAVKKYAELAPIPWEFVQIPYKDYVMDGYLALPRNFKPGETPIILNIAGATAFKDGAQKRVDAFNALGFAVFHFDGPGQGTTRFFNNGYLEIENEKAHSAVIDWVKKDGRFGKVIISGGSTGGYYVARTAATDKRVDGCIINGGSYNPIEILNYNPVYRHKFAILFGVTDEEVDELLPKMTMEGLAEQIECPLLIVHGGDDPIFLTESVQRIYDEAKSEDKTIMVYPGAWHCCAGEGSRAGRFTNDWLVDRFIKK